MKTLGIILILFVGLTACKTAEKSNTEASDTTASTSVEKDSLFAQISKTPCFGMCPVYTLTIYKSGYAKYVGKKNTDMIGTYESWIESSKLKPILHKAKEIGFFDMQESYDNPDVTDVPSVKFVINNNGRKEVLNRYGGPESLDELEKMFDQLIEQTAWKKVSGGSQY